MYIHTTEVNIWHWPQQVLESWISYVCTHYRSQYLTLAPTGAGVLDQLCIYTLQKSISNTGPNRCWSPGSAMYVHTTEVNIWHWPQQVLESWISYVYTHYRSQYLTLAPTGAGVLDQLCMYTLQKSISNTGPNRCWSPGSAMYIHTTEVNIWHWPQQVLESWISYVYTHYRSQYLTLAPTGAGVLDQLCIYTLQKSISDTGPNRCWSPGSAMYIHTTEVNIWHWPQQVLESWISYVCTHYRSQYLTLAPTGAGVLDQLCMYILQKSISDTGPNRCWSPGSAMYAHTTEVNI